MNVNVYVSHDGRHRTAALEGEQFILAEPVPKGVLLTEFSKDGDVLDQISMKGKAGEALHAALKGKELELIERADYDRVRVNAACKSCGERAMQRELDLVKPSLIYNVPVLPIFICAKCGKRSYSLNGAYLRKLIARHPDMFEDKELKDKEKDEAAFVKEIEAYIIRIFASKGLSRIEIG